MSQYYNWSLEDLVEVKLKGSYKFNLLAETLTRLGVSSVNKNENVLTQTCHVIQTLDDRLFIVHFKELYALDGREHTITKKDINRRNKIISLLEKWDTIEVLDPEKISEFNKNPMEGITVVKKENAKNWTFRKKYRLSLKCKHIKTFMDNIHSL